VPRTALLAFFLPLLLLCASPPFSPAERAAPFTFSVRALPAFRAASAAFRNVPLADACAELSAWIRSNGWTADGFLLPLPAKVPSGAPAEYTLLARIVSPSPPPPPSSPRKGFSLVETKPSLRVAASGRFALSDLPLLARSLAAEAGKAHYRVSGSPALYLSSAPPAQGPFDAVLMLAASTEGRADVAIYAGPGADYASTLALSVSLHRCGCSLSLLDSSKDGLRRLSRSARIVAFGGGWAPAAADALGESALAAVRSFVRKGGGFLGICAGAYLASSVVLWEGKRSSGALSLFPGAAVGPDASLAPWPRFTLARVKLEGPFVSLAPLERSVFYWGGPSFESLPRSASVPLRYLPSGRPAAVCLPFGKGRVFLFGPHPEFDLTSNADGLAWPESAGLRDPEPDADLLSAALSFLKEK